MWSMCEPFMALWPRLFLWTGSDNLFKLHCISSAHCWSPRRRSSPWNHCETTELSVKTIWCSGYSDTPGDLLHVASQQTQIEISVLKTDGDMSEEFVAEVVRFVIERTLTDMCLPLWREMLSHWCRTGHIRTHTLTLHVWTDENYGCTFREILWPP